MRQRQKLSRFGRRLLPVLIPGLLALSACENTPTTPIPNPSSSGNLGQLTLPGGPTASALPSATPATNGTNRVSNVMAWEVRPTGQAEPVSYLLGTVHAPLASNYRFPEKLISQLKTSKVFYMEADPAEAEALQAQIAQQIINPAADLDQRLGEKSWSELLKYLSDRKLSVTEQQLRFMQPWFVFQMLQVSPESVQSELMMDYLLQAQAQENKLALRYLESAQDSLNGVQTISEAEILRMIKVAVKDGFEAFKSDFSRIFTLYNRSDLSGFETLEAEAKAESAEYAEKAIYQRNRKWVATLKSVLKSDAAFVATGTLHMVGPEGLVKQLQAAGFDVKAVSY